MTDETPRWALPLLAAGQAQKELFHNEALARIDALLHGVAQSADLTVPPGAPDTGDSWIVADGSSGAWAGMDGMIACWTEGGWRFVAPRTGLCLHVADRGHGMVFDGSGWADAAVRDDGLYLGGDRVVGARGDAIATPSGGSFIDAEGRAAITSILDMLRMHGLIDS